MTGALSKPSYHKTAQACYGSFAKMLWSPIVTTMLTITSQ